MQVLKHSYFGPYFSSSCEEFYYGNPEIVFVGTCERCDCNGNSETCDTVTGECVNCSNNSTGFNCERCKDEWFGNSSAQACQRKTLYYKKKIYILLIHLDVFILTGACNLADSTFGQPTRIF